MATVVTIDYNAPMRGFIQKLNTLAVGDYITLCVWPSCHCGDNFHEYQFNLPVVIPDTYYRIGRGKERIYNFGFVVTEIISAAKVGDGSATLFIGAEKCAVLDNDILTIHDDLAELSGRYVHACVKIAALEKEATRMRAEMAELRVMVTALWYAPGGPAAAAAQVHFESL
jgi:hypothetical protein